MTRIVQASHLTVLAAVLAGVLVGLLTGFDTSAQQSYPVILPGDDNSGKWVCPIKTVGSEGSGGSGTCTSVGCVKSCNLCEDAFWVCAFSKSDPQTKCPPLEACEQR